MNHRGKFERYQSLSSCVEDIIQGLEMSIAQRIDISLSEEELSFFSNLNEHQRKVLDKYLASEFNRGIQEGRSREMYGESDL